MEFLTWYRSCRGSARSLPLETHSPSSLRIRVIKVSTAYVHGRYRGRVLYSLPTLTMLDDADITDEVWDCAVVIIHS